MSETHLEVPESEETSNITSDDQNTVPSHEDEESSDDITSDDDTDSSEDNEDEENDDGGSGEDKKKLFKNREERRKFFQQKKANDSALTRKEFYKSNDNKAVRMTTVARDDDPAEIKAAKAEIKENWSSIVKFFNPSTDRSDPEEIAEAIYDAHAAWKRRYGSGTETKDDTDNSARAKLMQDKGVRGSAASKDTGTKGKTILRNSSKGMDDWYPEE